MKVSELMSELVDTMARYGDIKVVVSLVTCMGDKDFGITGTDVYAKEFNIEFEPTNDEIDFIATELKEVKEDEVNI